MRPLSRLLNRLPLQNDLVTLSPNLADLHLVKLAISFALAQASSLLFAGCVHAVALLAGRRSKAPQRRCCRHSPTDSLSCRRSPPS